MLTEFTQRQIDELALDRERPLVICDVDDVVIDFTPSFEIYLAEQGLWIDRHRAAAAGNVRRRDTGEALDRREIRRLRRRFYADRMSHLEPIAGAVQSLREIGLHADVVMLSNLPYELAEARRRNLKDLGLGFPLIINSGAKGPAVKAIARGARPLVVFIDNRAICMTSACEHVPDAHLIHFLADEDSQWRSSPLPFVSLTTTSWSDAGRHILALLG
jgi:hypothetical protein